MGPDELLVAVKVEFDAELTTGRIAEAIDQAERRIREKVPAATMIFIEPDVYRPGEPEPEPEPEYGTD